LICSIIIWGTITYIMKKPSNKIFKIGGAEILYDYKHVWLIAIVIHKLNRNHKMTMDLLIFSFVIPLALWITYQWITYD
jgi:hypothetical protein